MTLADLLAFTGTWTVMMIAMMTPSVLPTVLFFRAAASDAPGVKRHVAPVLFIAGYFVAWSLLGLGVGALRASTEMALMPWHRPLATFALILAGIYQLTSWKAACLDHCRTPTHFFLRHWRPGAAGALFMGMHHGWFCVACCAGLMVALVALGLMNPWWMAAVALVVLAEKTAPGGKRLAVPVGITLIALGVSVWFGVIPVGDTMEGM